MKLAFVGLFYVLVFNPFSEYQLVFNIRIINCYYLFYPYHVPGIFLNVFYALTHSVLLSALGNRYDFMGGGL